MLNSRTDCGALAKEVLLHCDLIHPSRLLEVEQTIYYLKKRKSTQGNIKGNKNILQVSFYYVFRASVTVCTPFHVL